MYPVLTPDTASSEQCDAIWRCVSNGRLGTIPQFCRKKVDKGDTSKVRRIRQSACMSSYEYKALSLSKKIAHSTTVTPLFRASSFTSRSLVSSCIFARALRCSSRWIPNSCKDSVKCNNDGWHEASNNSRVEAPELVPDKLPPPAVVCTLPDFRRGTGEAALDETPGRVRGAFLGDCWETGSKRPFDWMLNDFFKGELGTG